MVLKCMTVLSMLISSPDRRQCRTVASNSWSKAPSIKHLFHSKRTFVVQICNTYSLSLNYIYYMYLILCVGIWCPEEIDRTFNGIPVLQYYNYFIINNRYCINKGLGVVA